MQENAPEVGASGDPRSGKYLTFALGREEFAIGVMKVREIIGVQEVTPVPHTPPFVKGVINLRGKVIPVIDLRVRFGIAELGCTQRTCVIVVDVEQGIATVSMGIIVDSVAEVLTLTEQEIQNTPDFGSEQACPFLLGLARVKGRVKILLDLDSVLTTSELIGMEQVLR